MAYTWLNQPTAPLGPSKKKNKAALSFRTVPPGLGSTKALRGLHHDSDGMISIDFPENNLMIIYLLPSGYLSYSSPWKDPLDAIKNGKPSISIRTIYTMAM